MSLGTLNFDDISEGDLKELVDVGVPEGLKIDYKRDLYGTSDNDKKEALKDISSFANSFGGHLIVGMDENKGIPTEITGLHGINTDTEIQRLENLVRDGIEPRITGLKIKAILLKSDKFVILIRIPKSWNPPHRVSARNVNRFYVRNSVGAHEVSVEELRSLFNLSASVHDRLQSFRRERLAILSADEGPMKIGHGGRLILHIVPFSAFGYGQSLDVKQIYNHVSTFQPLSSSGNNSRYNLEGVIVYRGDEKCSGYTQIFRNGIIEATEAGIVNSRDSRKLIVSLKFAKDIFGVLPGYLDGLKALDVPSPLAIMISLQEVHGAILGVRDDFSYDALDFLNKSFNKSELLLPEIIIEDYGTEQDYQRAMRPAFDALWNAAGYASSHCFSDDDLWKGK